MKMPAAGSAATADGTRLDALRAAALQQHRLAELGLGKPLRQPRAPHPPAAPPPAVAEPARAAGGLEAEAYEPPALSLAQRLGLVEAPPAKLSAVEWATVASQAATSGQSTRPCAICQEPFGCAGEQALLSCGHAFHRSCLRSWERHARRRTCPCCRAVHYQVCAIDDGFRAYSAQCATLLQAGWRGARARREHALRRARADPERLRSYCAARLDGLSDALLRRLGRGQGEADALLAQLERERGARLGLYAHAPDAEAADAPDPAEAAAARARARGVRECSVCLQPCVARRHSSGGSGLCVLSCSHVFHGACVQAFETFALARSAHTCPECRAVYMRWPYEPAEPRRAEPPVCAPCAPPGADSRERQPIPDVGAAAASERVSADEIERLLEARRALMRDAPKGLALARQLVHATSDEANGHHAKGKADARPLPAPAPAPAGGVRGGAAGRARARGGASTTSAGAHRTTIDAARR
jgi:hypothetical protein